MRTQKVLWDKAFQDELNRELAKGNVSITDKQAVEEVLDNICRRFFPDADDYVLCIPFKEREKT